MLNNKSITELRGIAQAMGVKWTFGDDKNALIQKIELKREVEVPLPPLPEIPLPPDQRLRTVEPAEVSEADYITEMLKPYMERGVRFKIHDDGQSWEMSCGGKSDSGTMRQPPRILLECAANLLKK